MPQSKILKQFELIFCPLCGKPFYIGIQSSLGCVASTPTMDDVKQAKEKIKERLEEINFNSEEDKQEIIAYLDNEETIVDYTDIEPMLRQVKYEQIDKKQKNDDASTKTLSH